MTLKDSVGEVLRFIPAHLAAINDPVDREEHMQAVTQVGMR